MLPDRPSDIRPTSESIRRLAQAALLETSAEGVAIIDAAARYLFVNDRLVQMLGRRREELVGHSVLETVAEEGRATVRDGLARRRAGLSEQLDVPLLRSDGAVVWALLATSPMFDESGMYVGALGTLTDLTVRKRAERALRILADATATLSESLDYEVTLANVARAVVPRLADACTIQLVEQRRLHLVAVAGAAGNEAADPVPGAVPPAPAVGPVQRRVAESGVSELLADGGGAASSGVAVGDGALAGRDAARPWAIVAPIKARRETLGVITVWSGTRRYDASDRELLEEIGARAALAVDHARLHRALEAQGVRLRILADTSRALSAQLEPAEVALAVASILRGAVVVALSSRAEPGLFVRACASLDAELDRRLQAVVGEPLRFPAESPGPEWLASAEPRLVAQNSSGGLPAPFGILAGGAGRGAVIVAALVAQGRAIGLMAVAGGPEGLALGAGEVELVREIADRAALAFERARLFESQKRATERLRLLADAGTLLAQSLEVGPTLTSLTRLAVDWFADACSVGLLEEGQVASIVVSARQPALEALFRRAIERYREAIRPPAALRALFESHRAELVRDASRRALQDFAIDDEHLESLASLGFGSLIVVPMAARGGSLGILTFARTAGAPPYDGGELGLAEEVGRRAALAVDNARLFKRATEAIAVRDEFLAIASHELNTPLTPLKMQLDSLRRGNFAENRRAEKLDAACRQVTRLTKLVSQLLDVSRISGGRLHIEAEPFDLAALVDEVVARMSEQAERAGCALTVRVDRPCAGAWDRMRIDQVLTNLLTNALKYGGGKPIEVELTHGDEAAQLVVRDHGIGIDPEHQRRIFERFERAASVRHYGGFGLGLWIARQIVEASGGSITVESAPGEGSMFVVRLPRDAAAADHAPTEPPAAVPATRRGATQS